MSYAVGTIDYEVLVFHFMVSYRYVSITSWYAGMHVYVQSYSYSLMNECNSIDLTPTQLIVGINSSCCC